MNQQAYVLCYNCDKYVGKHLKLGLDLFYFVWQFPNLFQILRTILFLDSLYSFNPYTGDFVHHQEKALREQYIDSKNIRKVLVDYKDNIWLGTRTGLFKVSNIKTQPKVESYNALISKDLNTTTKFNIITTLYEDKKKNIWIGTEGYGLCQLNTKNND